MIHSLVIGGFTVLLVYALFYEDIPETMPKTTPKTAPGSIPINDHHDRKVVLSCQTCRKLKNHVEIEPNLSSVLNVNVRWT